MRIAVLFGGNSMERDVSIATARQVVEALRGSGHEVLAVAMDRGALTQEEERAVLAAGIDRDPPPPLEGPQSSLPAIVASREHELANVDLVFLALHGGSGEDGTVQAVLELAGVPYTGSGPLGSALAMDKDVSKRLFLAAGIPTPQWLNPPVTAELVAQRLGFPVIVKPNRQGSTVGLTLVEEAADLEAAIRLAESFDGEALVERYVAGRELTVGVLDEMPLAVGEIIPAQGRIFDYTAKYQKDAAREIFPADLSPQDTKRAQELALAAHRALKLESYSRVDLRMDPQGGLWCLEVNTLPGLTPGSLLPQSAAAVGVTFAELCERICAAAVKKRRPRR